ncbi:diaminopimelate decarboxylase [Bacteroidales bacterium KA00344]|nr:diaminopimelate decarboxylase [Bacteroidales bacterium KA00344]
MKGMFPVDRFQDIQTPFYYYDVDLLKKTINIIKQESQRYENFVVHYAVKANANPKILRIVCKSGLGADCVSGGEIQACLDAGFSPNKIVYAGVGKSDWEINLALTAGIFCFNVESVAELEVINTLAQARNVTANVCFRINPDINAHTHANITTGLAENKFGIAMSEMEDAIAKANTMSNINFIGLHFHIGSQILNMNDYEQLCYRINDLQDTLESRGIKIQELNVGGGLGVDYESPNENPLPDFKAYFATYNRNLKLCKGQRVHFELGRAVVAQMGTLISRTLYIKQGMYKQFAILDAGMTDLIRPALYQARHKIENICNNAPEEVYDVVGPICESSDVFGKEIHINKLHRGDLVAIRSAGAYGEVMASQYNCRKLPIGYTSEELQKCE